MSSKRTFHVLYNDDDILLSAVKKIKEKHYDIEEVYTPFPVHGLDKVLGLKPTRLAITAFMYGCVGITVAILMMYSRASCLLFCILPSRIAFFIDFFRIPISGPCCMLKSFIISIPSIGG